MTEQKLEEKFSISGMLIILFVHILALGGLYHFSWEAFFAFLFAHYFFLVFGVSLGLHTYLSHNAFEVKPWVKKIMLFVSTLTLQGGPIFWVAVHRSHHINSDQYGDPHSANRGFFWSHMGWMMYENPNGFNMKKSLKLVRHLLKDKYITFLEKHNLKINLAQFIVGFLFFYLLNRLDLFFWLIPIRIISVWHTAWLVNSYVHGAQNKLIGKEVKVINSHLVSYILGGEGFHKNHHDYPNRASNVIGSFKFQFAYSLLKLMEVFKMAKINKV